MSIAIKAENLSKAYQLGQIGTGTISRDLERWYARIGGKEDPYLRIGETNDRTSKGNSDVVWSLKDINFEIEQGDAVGIIGRNGAGKSTLLKVLSRVTSPTTGRITGKGRIASLLEVGTGFHPELTGRENIYLNGAILGMRKKEITRKFDEIVDFAGVERYIDTPVKRYSSGMYVRLAFAVAAHLESEILIVDEVLAVGDAEFQKKCLGKMGEVSKGEGRTVLFVSHNMGSVKTLCDKAILLNQGLLYAIGDANQIIPQYSKATANNQSKRIGGNMVYVKAVSYYCNAIEVSSGEILHGEPLRIVLQIEALEDYNDVSIALCFNDSNNQRMTSVWTKYNGQLFSLKKGIQQFDLQIHSLRLVPDAYQLITYIETKGQILEQINHFDEILVTPANHSKSLEVPVSGLGSYVEVFEAKLRYD
ncbi:ABC transporter ATP-binding protein [Pedobacter helvus]|uniref:Polysaccharide ABC transporter ATP-binding protein n=1 Tax=Pedobacter helvus TaxID=2563444 RepID=A0ABW9JL32_9SPHI|nr:ABC transporter ATP-binding protein [Pedobacter ureilyticus]